MKDIIQNLIDTKKTVTAIKRHLTKHNILLYNTILEKSPKIKTNNFSLKLYCAYNGIDILPLCPICHVKPLVYKNFFVGFTKYCSISCAAKAPDKIKNCINTKIKKNGQNFQKKAAKKSKQTWIEKYGVDNPNKCHSVREKIKKTNLKKYGVNYTFQRDEQRQQSKQTCLKKYGVEYFTQSLDYKNKIKEHSLNKYNTTHYLKNKNVIQKRKTTMLHKYGVDNIFKSKKFQKSNQEKYKKNFFENNILKMQDYTPLFTLKDYINTKQEYLWQCNKCNKQFTFIGYSGFTKIYCPHCDVDGRSLLEGKIKNYINTIYNKKILYNTKKILNNKKELDFYIPDKKIAIEINGNYWHSENNSFTPKFKSYHLEKTKECEKNNIRLIHIFEDEWVHKPQIVKNRLKHILELTKYKIYGRKCIIKEIDTSLKNKFLNKYHIQGEDKSKVKLGAYYKNRLVAVMTFGKRKITGTKELEWELIRYATLGSFNCIGVASKILKHFERNWKPKKIISYADRRWSQGNLYYQLGFKLTHTSSPNYWYLNKLNYYHRIHRTMFMKHKLKNKLKRYNNKLSEWENMKINGYDRIWDCGNYVFEKSH